MTWRRKRTLLRGTSAYFGDPASSHQWLHWKLFQLQGGATSVLLFPASLKVIAISLTKTSDHDLPGSVFVSVTQQSPTQQGFIPSTRVNNIDLFSYCLAVVVVVVLQICGHSRQRQTDWPLVFTMSQQTPVDWIRGSCRILISPDGNGTPTKSMHVG